MDHDMLCSDVTVWKREIAVESVSPFRPSFGFDPGGQGVLFAEKVGHVQSHNPS